MIHQSKYNIIVPHNNTYYIYNTLSGAIMKSASMSIFEDERYINFLLQQGFVTEEDDELNQYKFKYYKRMFDYKFLNVNIVPTMCCNLSCYYCFEGTKQGGYMEQNTIESLVKFLSAFPDKGIGITWFGGEPLLAFPIIEEINEKLKSANIKFRSSLITNGTLLTSKIRKRISNLDLDHIQITFDGNREQHDSKRFFKNNKGTFDIIIENLKGLIQETEINVNIQINIDKTNFTSYETIYLMLYELFPNEIKNKRLQIGYNRVQNRTDFDTCNTCIPDESYFDIIKSFANLRSQAQKPLRLPLTNMPCMLRSISSFVIGPNGDIYKCLEHIGKKGKKIGNINSLSVSKKKIAQYAMSYIPFDDPECINCKLLPICGGGCPLDREKKEKGIITSTCVFLKENIKELIISIYEDINK